MTNENILSRPEFQHKLNILYSECPSGNRRSYWDKKQECTTIKFLQEVNDYSIKKSISPCHYAKTYEEAKMGNEICVILKRHHVID